MSKFRVGDEILIISPPDNNEELVGLIGTVCNIEPEIFDNLTVEVKLKTPISKTWDSWWCEEESLQLLEEEN